MVNDFANGIGVQSHFNAQVETVMSLTLAQIAVDHDDDDQAMKDRIDLVLTVGKYQFGFAGFQMEKFLRMYTQLFRDIFDINRFDLRQFIIGAGKVIKGFKVRDFLAMRIHEGYLIKAKG